MIITLKNLQQQTFQVEMDDAATVKQLKDKIHEDKGAEYPADNQRLIYAGKILADDQTLRHYSIDPKKFIVVMVTKPKTEAAQATASASASAPSGESAPAAPSVPAPPSTATPARPPAAAATAAPAATPAAAPVSATAPIASVDPEESAAREQRVQALLDMGYARPQVERALRASFDNQERAVEYLINGIPDELLLDQADRPEGEGDGDGDGEGDDSEDPLAFLRDQPQFQQMRAVIQQDPSLLHAILQQIGQTNPALLQAISQHQQAFVRMLNEPAGGGGTGAPAGTGAAPRSGGGGGGRMTLALSAQDKDAIDRLKALGFPEHLVIQAYFACEKNENLAANFLLSMNMDD